MTSFEGINDNNKPSSKVLRPPGGGTSDIFGGDMPQTPRALVKNHMQSNIFSTEKDHVKNSGDHPRRAQKNLDSYQRLFGEPERPMTPAKNHMKSNIPFGSTTAEAAQALIANGNGHYNGKSGSVSSASSSVSSSTENLKINGHSKTEPDEMCPPPVSSSTSPRTEKSEASNIEVNCEEKKSLDSARSKISERPDIGSIHETSQTRQDSGCNPDNPNSLTTASETHSREEPLEACVDKPPKPATPRNPITGLGLGNDGVGGLKPKKPKSRRDGNPVTGEGYKTNDYNNHTPSMNGANQIINKNRIPPGGYSSGLW